MSLHEQLKQYKQNLEERRQALIAIFEKHDPTGYHEVSLNRLRDKSQSWIHGFRWGDDQKRLDILHTIVHDIYDRYKNNSNFKGVQFMYSGKTKYLHHVGPPVDELIKDASGDFDYACLRIVFADLDY